MQFPKRWEANKLWQIVAAAANVGKGGQERTLEMNIEFRGDPAGGRAKGILWRCQPLPPPFLRLLLLVFKQTGSQGRGGGKPMGQHNAARTLRLPAAASWLGAELRPSPRWPAAAWPSRLGLAPSAPCRSPPPELEGDAEVGG